MRIIFVFISFISLYFISGCGGGGTAVQAPPVATALIYQLKAAYVNYVTSIQSLPFTLTANYQGQLITGSGTLSQDSVKSGIFEGKAALQKATTITGTMNANGQAIPLAITSVSYVDSNYSPLGDVTTGYGVVTGSVNIPATAVLGSTGVWFTENIYRTNSKANLIGIGTMSYVVEADSSPNTAILKIIQNMTDSGNTLVSSGTVIFRMTPSGSLTRLSETGTVNGITISIQY